MRRKYTGPRRSEVFPHGSARRRGTMLIVALGVLSLLAVLAVTFASMSSIERYVSGTYVDQVRARLLAQAGIEEAVLRLKKSLNLELIDYFGEDWNADGTDNLDDTNGDGNGVLNVSDAPLRYARRPSFFQGVDTDGDGIPDEPNLIEVYDNGAIRMRGYSGQVPGTYTGDGGDTFVVAVEDTSSKVFLNGVGDGYRRLFNNLGDLLNPAIVSLGDLVQLGNDFGNNPYSTPGDLVTRGVLTQSEFEQLEPFVTTYAWVDRGTMRPDPVVYIMQAPSNMRSNDWIEPRAPVNINKADPLIVRASLTGIKGYFIGDNFNGPWTSERNDDTLDRYYGVVDDEHGSETDHQQKLTVEITSDMAQFVGGRIVDYLEGPDGTRGTADDNPFGTWAEFYEFLIRIVLERTTDSAGEDFGWRHAAVIFANANPNTKLNKWGLDIPVPYTGGRDNGSNGWDDENFSSMFWADKSDLLQYTTEFTFQSSGYYNIRSLGRVLGSDRHTLAEEEICAVVQAFELKRITTQRDFEDNWINRGSVPFVQTYPEEVNDLPSTESYTDGDGDGLFRPKNDFGFGSSDSGGGGDNILEGAAIYDGQVALRPRDDFSWNSEAALALRCLYNTAPSYGLSPSLAPDISSLGPQVDSDSDGYLDDPAYHSDVSTDYCKSSTETQTHWPSAGMAPMGTTLDNGRSLLVGVGDADSWDSDPQEYSDLLPNGALFHYGREEYQVFYAVDNWPMNVSQDNGSGSCEFWYRPDWWRRSSGHSSAVNDWYSHISAQRVHFVNRNKSYRSAGRWYYYARGTIAWFFGYEPRFVLHSYWHSYGGAGISADITDGFLYFDDGWRYDASENFLGSDFIDLDTMVVDSWAEVYTNPQSTSSPRYPLFANQWYYICLRWKNVTEYEILLDDQIYRDSSPTYYSGLRLDPFDEGILNNGEPIHENPFGFAADLIYDEYPNAVCDDLRTFATFAPDPGYKPNRYYPSGAMDYGYEGRFSMPDGSKLRSISWTTYRPDTDYKGEVISNANRPDILVGYKNSSAGSYTSAPGDGSEVVIDPATAPSFNGGESIDLELEFVDNGLVPFRNAPVLDDLTVTYTRGPVRFLSYYIVKD